MSFAKKAQPIRKHKVSKRVLLSETREEEAARLEKEIATHPVTQCPPGAVIEDLLEIVHAQLDIPAHPYAARAILVE